MAVRAAGEDPRSAFFFHRATGAWRAGRIWQIFAGTPWRGVGAEGGAAVDALRASCPRVHSKGVHAASSLASVARPSKQRRRGGSNKRRSGLRPCLVPKIFGKWTL